MRTPTTATFRALKAELRYLAYSRTVLVLCAVVGLGAGVAFVSSLGAARSAHDNFVHQVQVFEANGITLESALAAPVVVTANGNAETIDNPLKYDYLQVGEAVHAVDGILPFVGTALDFVTFIVIPIVMIAIGLFVATNDRKNRTLKLRASRERWSDLVLGKFLAITAMAAVATVATAVAAAVIAIAGSPAVAALNGAIEYQIVEPNSMSPLALKLVLTMAFALFFGVLGYATGVVTGSTSWPLVIFTALLFLLPFMSIWDPRNLMAVLGSQVYDFWGQFRMRPPLEAGLTTSALALVGYGAVVLALAALFPRPSRRFS